jgi:rhomboid protease GluP
VCAWGLQRSLAFGFDWEALGRNEVAAVRDGQWWRAVTALTLHADVPHLVGNLVFGAGFGFLVGQLLGNGLGWLAILTAGSLGNLAGAWIRPLHQSSLGASTAVFAAIGVLVAAALRLAGRADRGRLQRWAPLPLGLALLGYLGTAGERTDLLAHVLGLLTGIILGLPLTRPERPRPGRAV